MLSAGSPYPHQPARRVREMASKKQRERIRATTDGHCYYCGCELPESGWHIDHVKPLLRQSRWDGDSSSFVQTGYSTNPEHDNEENMVPACAPCNLFKSSSGYGLITVNDVDVKFWFEKQPN